MAHECPECGEACYCDQEDTWFEDSPDDCIHWTVCEREPDYDEYIEEAP